MFRCGRCCLSLDFCGNRTPGPLRRKRLNEVEDIRPQKLTVAQYQKPVTRRHQVISIYRGEPVLVFRPNCEGEEKRDTNAGRYICFEQHRVGGSCHDARLDAVLSE